MALSASPRQLYNHSGLYRQNAMKKLRKVIWIFAAAYLALMAGLFVVMHRPILFGETMRHVPDPLMMAVPFKQLWFLARAGNVQVGDMAPAFTLPTANRQASVSLASFRGQKPVVLVFGSYT